MFEKYLFNKYKEYIVGFVYEINYKKYGSFDIQTYFVLKKDNKIKFIKYRFYKDLNDREINNVIANLEAIGYEPLESILLKENRKNIKKILFKVLK